MNKNYKEAIRLNKERLLDDIKYVSYLRYWINDYLNSKNVDIEVYKGKIIIKEVK